MLDDIPQSEPKFNRFTDKVWTFVQGILIVLVTTIGGIVYANIRDTETISHKVVTLEKEVEETKKVQDNFNPWRDEILNKLNEQLIAIKVLENEVKNTNEILKNKKK